jgi:two-component system cell cycle sensor histidine kinase/response regulator CckA
MMITTTDLGSIVHLNAAFSAAFGYRQEDLPTAARWFELAFPDPDDRREVKAQWVSLGEAIPSGDSRRGPVVSMTAGDGRVVEVRIEGMIWGDRLVALFRDVGAQRAAEAERRELAEFRDAISEGSTDGLMILEPIDEPPHLRCRLWNKRMEEITGYGFEEINAEGWYPLVYGESLETAKERRPFLEGRLLHDETPRSITRGDGTTRRILVTSRRLGDRYARVLVLIKDVTEPRAAGDEHRRLQVRFEEAQRLESLGVLAGGIAHDFNNLLAGILGHAELALAALPAQPEEARTSLEAIRAVSRRTAELTGQMLAYAGQGSTLEKPLDVQEIVDEMFSLLRASVPRKVELQRRVDGELPAVLGDRGQLRQVLLNLLTNGAEAIGAGRGTVTLTARPVRVAPSEVLGVGRAEPLPAGLYVLIEVTDDGAGMSTETAARMFDPFFTTKFTGRGLGLAAVHGIVRRHRGAIQFESEEGAGTTFRLWLPGVSRPTAVPRSPAPAPAIRRGQRALVVDDEAAVRETTARILRRSGYRVQAVDNSADAIDLFRRAQHAADLVVLDLTMPDLDGAECLAQLRTLRPDLPVVMMSGFPEDTVRETVGEQPLQGFLQKPFTAAELRRAVREALDVPWESSSADA